MGAFQPHMRMIVDHLELFATILAVNGPGVVTDLGHMYLYPNWGGWVLDLAFERQLRHSREQAKSVFVVCNNVGCFLLLIALRLFCYMLLPVSWTETVFCADICPILTPWF